MIFTSRTNAKQKLVSEGFMPRLLTNPNNASSPGTATWRTKAGYGAKIYEREAGWLVMYGPTVAGPFKFNTFREIKDVEGFSRGR